MRACRTAKARIACARRERRSQSRIRVTFETNAARTTRSLGRSVQVLVGGPTLAASCAGGTVASYLTSRRWPPPIRWARSPGRSPGQVARKGRSTAKLAGRASISSPLAMRPLPGSGWRSCRTISAEPSWRGELGPCLPPLACQGRSCPPRSTPRRGRSPAVRAFIDRLAEAFRPGKIVS